MTLPWTCLMLLFTFVLEARSEPVVVYNLPAVRHLGEAGRLHGQLASLRIREFLQTKEIADVLNFTRSTAGDALLQSLKQQATTVTPWLAEEINGIAEGAAVSIDDIWAVNLVSELEAGEKVRKSHCSDVMAREASGGAVWHGHTEDWSVEFRPLLYFVIYNAGPSSTFYPVGGLVYPGQAPGFAVTFTPTVWSTSNSMFPIGLNRSGLFVASVTREALQSGDAEGIARRYTRVGQAYGMNQQVVDNRPGRAYAAGIEIAGAAGKARITEVMDNYTHFNNYKYLDVPFDVNPSSTHRQAAADRHRAPRSREDVVSILGDTSDAMFPFYRANHTMFAFIFHSESGRFEVWHGQNPNQSQPDWQSSLQDVFQESSLANIAMV